MTTRIFIKLILGVVLVLIVAMSIVDYLAKHVAETTYITTLTRELVEKARMLETAKPTFSELPQNEIQDIAHAAGTRITMIDHQGQVLAESDANRAQMENHAGRPEMKAALNGQIGSDTRTSSTIGVRMLYVAVPFQNGALRLAVPLRDIDAQVNSIRGQLLTSVIVAFLPTILIAAFFARYVSSKLAQIIQYAGKLARGDFHARLKISTRDELGLLSEQLNETGEKLQKMFEELQREHEQLEKLERIRKDFVINVSHELRTPLASIQGYTETLLDGAIHDPDNNLRFLSIIRANAERLGRLTGDLMTLSRLELKTTKFQFASYFANALIEDCVESILPMAEKKHISITMEPAPERTEVFCDSEAVHQIITNLLDNALKYTPEHGSILVGGAAKPGGEWVEFFIQDTGIGIPEEDLPRLFERFYRVDKARSRELGGTGLGLAIVKHLVRAQGGAVGVTSKVNQGSRFYFTLPVHDLGLMEQSEVQAELTSL